MILVLRGHIRNAFETPQLLHFVKGLHATYPDLKIFVHTWNIFANDISWRTFEANLAPVNVSTILDYFSDMKGLVKHVLIDDDKQIQLVGNVEGKINNGRMPLVGWKNYWYGKFRIADWLFSSGADRAEPLVNCRFDVFQNSNKFREDDVSNFVAKHCKDSFDKNVFLFQEENHLGIDNVYMGNVVTMHKLASMFFYDLDIILAKNKDIKNQEKLVFRINKTEL
jgi:hypothetical protein